MKRAPAARAVLLLVLSACGPKLPSEPDKHQLRGDGRSLCDGFLKRPQEPSGRPAEAATPPDGRENWESRLDEPASARPEPEDSARYKSELSYEESASPGAPGRNIRRAFRVIGHGEQSQRVLWCREVDTNYDGSKDVVRIYDVRGSPEQEASDSNYDGELDTWTTFAKGRISKLEIDKNADGRPDETRFYREGKLARVHLDTNVDGTEDVFEIYRDGRLERIGIDVDQEGQVDHWLKDEEQIPSPPRDAKEE